MNSAVGCTADGGHTAAPRLWLVRHAPPLIAPGHCYGALDVPADPAATAHSASQLASVLPRGMVMHHSPLQRCELLAHALQGLRPDLTSTPDARLAEMNFGAWEGRPWSSLGRSALDAWTADFAEHRPGGGENLATVLARVAQALQAARHSAQAQRTDVLWITHAGVARCVQWLLQSAPGVAPRADQWPLAAPGFGGYSSVVLG